MSGPQRYVLEPGASGSLGTPGLEPHPDGEAVLFADVEPALKDAKRYLWLKPLFCADEMTPEAHRKLAALQVGRTVGRRGNELVDQAMREVP